MSKPFDPAVALFDMAVGMGTGQMDRAVVIMGAYILYRLKGHAAPDASADDTVKEFFKQIMDKLP